MQFLRVLAAAAFVAALSCLLAHKPADAQGVLAYHAEAYQSAAQPTPQPYLLARPAFTPFRPWLYGRVWVTPPAYYAVPLTPVVPTPVYPAR